MLISISCIAILNLIVEFHRLYLGLCKNPFIIYSNSAASRRAVGIVAGTPQDHVCESSPLGPYLTHNSDAERLCMTTKYSLGIGNATAWRSLKSQGDPRVGRENLSLTSTQPQVLESKLQYRIGLILPEQVVDAADQIRRMHCLSDRTSQ